MVGVMPDLVVVDDTATRELEPGATTLFCSVGLAGTEAALAAAAIERLE